MKDEKHVNSNGPLPATAEPHVADEIEEQQALSKQEERELAMQAGIQALWSAVLPAVGARAAVSGEFPGVFKVEPGPADDEATVYVDIRSEEYEEGEESGLDRVLALTVKLSHDYRKFGERYYCIDCEAPSTETQH